MKPKVSVLLPAYNHQSYIADTIESLLQQTEKDIEIIAVDDGSTDQTGAILDEYARKDSRVKVFHKPNGGVVSALNYGLDRAYGVWIATCGSDDRVPPQAFSRMLKAGRDADVVIGEFIEFDDEGRTTPVRLGHRIGNSCFQAMFAMPATWNKLFRTELIVQNGLRFPDVRICEDLIFLAEVAACTPRYRFIPQVVYLYRNNASCADSMSHHYSVDTFQDHLDGRLVVERICNGSGIHQGKDYVYRDSLPYLANYIQHLWGDDQTSAVGAFRRFMLQGEEYMDKSQFERLFGVRWEQFKEMSDAEYAQRVRHITHEEWVLRKYRSGEIGLSFLVRCLRNWIAYRKEKWR